MYTCGCTCNFNRIYLQANIQMYSNANSYLNVCVFLQITVVSFLSSASVKQTYYLYLKVCGIQCED